MSSFNAAHAVSGVAHESVCITDLSMSLVSTTKRSLIRLFGLWKGTDVNATIADIKGGVRLRGANVWMLICSAILASIGLDVNSAAVIIGAMLISPLMSPILGVGLSVAIFDRALLRNSLKNLLFSVILGLLTSALYFWVSPFSQLTPELSARTMPTLLDVGVAFFGGVAGIIAGSRQSKTTAIPGVAIATALMPPLCTAGFGIANLNSSVFLGAFYLLFINAVFIALATYLVALFLQFPRVETPSGQTAAQVKRFVVGFVVLTLVPCSFIFAKVIQDVRIRKSVERFINTECRTDERQVLEWALDENGSEKLLKVYIVGRKVDEGEQQRLQQILSTYPPGNLTFRPIQLDVSPDEFKQLNRDIKANLAESLKLLQARVDDQEATIAALKGNLDSMGEISDPRMRFLSDTKKLFPDLVHIDWGRPGADNKTQGSRTTLEVSFRPELGAPAKAEAINRIRERGRVVLGDRTLSVIEITSASEGETQTENPKK
ncbi:MAG: TIGR00341 family protein [Acidobacteria bacterium]|nr:MAG: TIGR00341 family protein [Acidobacteriota bacterium]